MKVSNDSIKGMKNAGPREMSILVELIDFFENRRLLSESSAGSKVLLLPKTRNLMIQKITTQMCV